MTVTFLHFDLPVLPSCVAAADAVLMDTKTYEKYLRASNMATLLAQGEVDVTGRRTRPIRSNSDMSIKFRVRITRAAEKDIEEAWSFIAEDSPEEAEEFVRR